MVMSKKGNNCVFVFLCFCVFVFLCFSCDNQKEKKMRELYYVNSVKTIGLDEYYDIYNQAIDSINNWIQNDLRGGLMQKSALEWLLDSLICFNQEGNKCIMAIMNRDQGGVNSINHFHGVKIRSHWYFFCGPTLYAFSEFYDLPPKIPLSFEKLKQIATSHIYRGYLKKGKGGQWEINERFFDRIIPSYNLKTDEEYVMFMVEVNWSSDVNETIRKYYEDDN